MRFYIGFIECKIHHQERMEWLWIREKFGDELTKELNQDWCDTQLVRRKHPTLPDDIFKLVDIYVDVQGPRASLFALKYGLEAEANE